MENKEINYTRCGRIAAAIAIIIGLLFYFVGRPIITHAATTADSNTQVRINYYTGKPTNQVSYASAYSNGDTAVGKVDYTTKSKGRLQWGEPDASGNYAVYYDAADIHLMAAYLNVTEAEYEALYQKYLDAYKAVME